MDLKTLFGIAHIIGIALGVGGATVSDIFFMRILKSKRINKTDFENLRVLSRIVWAGIITLILSGAGFLWLMYDSNGTIGILNSPRFQAKLTLVAIVFLNGLVFHFFVFPRLKGMIGKGNALSKRIWLLAITGAISGATWYSIVIIAMLRGIDLPYIGWIGAYLVVATGGILTAKTLITKLLK